MHIFRISAYALTVLATAGFAWLTPVTAQRQSLDYPQWRGQTRDGSASAFTPPAKWPARLTMRWKVEVGVGYATPIVVGDRVYAYARQAGDEVMMALDAATGKTLWQTRYPAPYQMNASTAAHGEGPKSTPLHHGGMLYTLGIGGIVSAFDASAGALRWQKPATAVQPIYGTAMSPVTDGDIVIFHVGGHDNGALTAFDARSGDVVWAWTGDGPAYAAPMIAEIGGTRQVVAVTQGLVVGVDVATGRLLWQRPLVSPATTNSTTPIIAGDTIIVSTQDAGVSAFRPVRTGREWSVESIWHVDEVAVKLSNPVLVGDTLYGLSHRNSGQLFALDAKTGKVLWLGDPRQGDRNVGMAIVKAGDLLFLLNTDGELAVARAARTGIEPLHRYTVADTPTWAQPAISGSRIFVKDLSSLTLWSLN